MKVLLTGGGGFIGHHLAKRFPNVFVLDKLTYAADPERITNVPHLICDLADGVPDAIGGFDVVIHTAAESHVDRSLADAREFVRSNVQGTQQLLEWMRRQKNPPLLVHFSTDEVYGEATEPFKEGDSLTPGNPYAASKVGAEAMCRAYAHTYNLPIIIVRPTNTYGTGQYPEKLIPILVNNAEKGVTLHTNDGVFPSRQWLNVDDLCDAIETIIEKGTVGETYNISGDEERTNKEILDLVGTTLGVRIPYITSDTARVGGDKRYAVDDSKLRALGWKPIRTLEQSLPEICH